MNIHSTDLSSLISTRICHDLVNPIGAISNGLELLGELQLNTGPEFGLITDSVASANAKLGFFRIAFGEARSDSELPTALAARTINAMYGDGRFKARWQVQTDPILRTHAKLAFLLIQCVESSLPLGGSCTVSRENTMWRVDGTGSRIQVDETLWAMFEDGATDDDLSSSNVHFAVGAQTAARLAARVTLNSGNAGLSASFAI